MAADGAGLAELKVWDGAVRLVHWSFVLLLPALWGSAEWGNMEVHRQLGIVMLGLVAFRIIWGFLGSETARFASFVAGPARIRDYLRRSRAGEPLAIIGHNPLGAISVLALLGLLAAQVTIGLFTQDVDGLESGPLTKYISYETADAMREWHELGFNLILAMVAVHIAAILFYLVVKRDNLVRPMITGRRAFPGSQAAPVMAPLWRLLLSAALAATFAWWIGAGAPLG